MYSVKIARMSVSGLALSLLAACATTSGGAQSDAEDAAYKLAMEQAMQPASAEEVELAERSDPLTRANFWANEYRKNAGDLETTVKFLSALRRIGSHERIREVANVALPQHPDSYELYLEIGRSLLADNKAAEASQALVRAADLSPGHVAAPLAALGLAFDRMELHEKAQQAYRFALEREPQRVSTLSNYGLSLAMSGALSEAEATLKQAVALPGADVRIRQNLALVLGLQGKYDEMATVDPSAPRRTVEANMKTLRDMMLPTRSYEDLQAYEEQEAYSGPTETQPMPEVAEAVVTADAMTDPQPDTAVATQTEALSGETDSTSALRPKLRGTKGG